MILQERNGGWLMFRQTDHALLSGAFARAWESLERRDELLVAAARHDDGWAEWELAPKLRSDGQPVDFIHVPVSDHVPLYRRGIDLVERENDYAGLIASMHGERLYTRPFHPGMDPRIDHLKGEDLEIATEYVHHEVERQERLMRRSGAMREVAEEAWRLLQVWDRLSLFACMQPLDGDAKQTMPPVRANGGDVKIEVAASGGDIVLSPYPFASDPCDFDTAAVVTDKKAWGTETEFRADFREAERLVLRFACRSA